MHPTTNIGCVLIIGPIGIFLQIFKHLMDLSVSLYIVVNSALHVTLFLQFYAVFAHEV